MRTIGGFAFPDSRDEALTWEPTMLVRGLQTHVVAVGRSRIEGNWSCYVVRLPDDCESHVAGAAEHWGQGAKVVDETLARALFPQFEGVPLSM